MENQKEKMEWLEYDLLEGYPHVVHGVFSRRGGISHGHCDSLNVGDGTSDKAEHVKTNREIIRKAVDAKQLADRHFHIPQAGFSFCCDSHCSSMTSERRRARLGARGGVRWSYVAIPVAERGGAAKDTVGPSGDQQKPADFK